MKDLKKLTFTSDSGRVINTNGEICYSVTMPPKKPDYSLFAEGDFASDGYFVLEYSTMGWRRSCGLVKCNMFIAYLSAVSAYMPQARY